MRVLLVTFVKYTLSQHNSHCNRNYFLVLFGDWKLLFCNKKLFKSLSYLCICFAQKIAGLILERLRLLGNGWSFSCPTPRWIAFLMFYCLVFNILPDFHLKCVVEDDFEFCQSRWNPTSFYAKVVNIEFTSSLSYLGSISIIMLLFTDIFRNYWNRTLAWNRLKFPVHEWWCSNYFHIQN